MKNIGMLLCLFLFSMQSFAVESEEKLVFYTQEFAPFSYSENGRVAGPGVEIIQKACDNINVKCVIEVLPWVRAQEEVKRGNADGMFFVGKNKEREEWLDFSIPIINTEYGFFGNKETPISYNDIKDLSGKTVGVYGHSNTSLSLDEAVKGMNRIAVEMTVDDAIEFRKLNAKRVDAVYSNKSVGEAIIKQLKLTKVEYYGTHKKLQYFIGLHKNTTKTLEERFFNEISIMSKKGDIDEILKRYNLR